VPIKHHIAGRRRRIKALLDRQQGCTYDCVRMRAQRPKLLHWRPDKGFSPVAIDQHAAKFEAHRLVLQ